MSLLEFLPPPPDVSIPSKRGPTRKIIPASKELTLVPTTPKIKPARKCDEKERQQQPTTKYINQKSFRNDSVFLRVTMEESEVSVRKVPIMIERHGRSYPEKATTISCWWDKARFTSRPIGCPFKYDRKQDAFFCEGIFCSYSCAKAYGVASGKEHFRFCGSLLLHLRKKIDKINYAIPLESSPHWSTLKSFGGHLTLRDFRSFESFSYRLKAIPEQLKCFLYGFNIFEHRESRKTAVYTYRALRAKGSSSFRKNGHGVKERARKRRLTDSVSKTLNRIKISKKSVQPAKIVMINKFLTTKKKKKILEI